MFNCSTRWSNLLELTAKRARDQIVDKWWLLFGLRVARWFSGPISWIWFMDEWWFCVCGFFFIFVNFLGLSVWGIKNLEWNWRVKKDWNFFLSLFFLFEFRFLVFIEIFKCIFLSLTSNTYNALDFFNSYQSC